MLDTLGIIPVRIPLPFRLNHVNCFLAEGENGWAVIDAGLNNEETMKLWKEQLEGKEVSDLIITHYHPDHYGYAGALQQKTGAKVHMSQVDAEAGGQAWSEEFLHRLDGQYRIAGIPDELAEQMKGNTADFIPRVTPYPLVHHFLEEGEKIQIGKYAYEVFFTPGHSDGLVCFYNREKNVLLSTDHILPKITPNISYWFHGDDNPLQSYLHSLNKIKTLDAEFVIPSHGSPFYGANRRIDEILQHHEDRLELIAGTIKNGATVYDICQASFQRELSVHEMRFAVGETIAHLEFLRYRGDCRREVNNESWIYLRE